jgi:polyvinyl alcohol dehydrogenase (cytochrome)
MAAPNGRSDRLVMALVMALVVTFALAACSGSNKNADRPNSATTTTVQRGSHADSGTAPGWPMYRHDFANTGSVSNDAKITATNVDTLSKVWSKAAMTGVTGTPAVVDGVVYFGDWGGSVSALKADGGDKLWSTSLGGGWVIGAPAVHDDALFVGAGKTLFRLNTRTGAIVWRAMTNDSGLSQINGSPVYVDGLVLQATAGIQDAVPDPTNSFRGTIGAYDADTGKEVWRFYATPANKSAGSGVGIWSTPAVDEARGLLYIGTGNTSSEPTAPLADALLAINYKTGKLAWSKQFTARDVFPGGHPTGKDVDVGASPNLWTSDGRDLVGVGDKGGNYHVLDRASGEVVWQTSLTPGSVFGGVIGSAAFVDGRLIMSSNIGDPKTNAPTNASKIFSLDPATGKIQWSTAALTGKVFGPVSALPRVAFVGTDANTMYAFDTATGKKLWSFDAPGKIGGGPAVVNGHVYWGYGFILFGGASEGGVIDFTPRP